MKRGRKVNFSHRVTALILLDRGKELRIPTNKSIRPSRPSPSVSVHQYCRHYSKKKKVVPF
jgi:hypothetical protein